MKIEIYTCSFGNGHKAQAKAIKKKLVSKYEVELVDVCEALFPNYDKMIYYGYRKMVEKRGLMNKLYRKVNATDKNSVDQLKALKKWSFACLDKRPRVDAWIATHSLTAHILAKYKIERNLTLPIITCITDINPHDMWVNEGTDLYLVASEETKDILINKGVEESNILIYGLAEDRFNMDKNAIKSVYPLHVLISGGGLGLLPKKLKFYKTIASITGAQIRVLCGRNGVLYKKLNRASIPGLTAYKFANDVETHLKWAHLFVGKPGGISTFEAIYAETPILYIQPFLTQESHNSQFINNEGIGMELTLENLKKIANEQIDLSLCQQNMKRIKASFEPEELLTWLEKHCNKGAS